ncbi:ABC transporter permease [Halobellus inordinatus]|uniref:ABC transporter permease n=1 Tax=Halobellus inordinatus TaxID=1126236 RepID=UPI0021095893|nr:ABC transporter permease [Halobellus inordinatus]
MGLKWYTARRVAWAGVVAFVILTVTFVLLEHAPDAQLARVQFQAAASGRSAEAAAEAYARRRGLQGPLWERYLEYLGNLASGDWGWSDSRSQPVVTAILTALPYSLLYTIPAVLLSTVLGIGIGLYSAFNQYTKTDYAATFVAFFGVSIPNFWFGIVLLLVFAVRLGWVPVLFDAELARTRPLSLANARQLALPVFVLATSAIASTMRYARAEALEYVRAAFVKTARAKGASDWRIITRHVLRPTLVPLSTILVGDLLGVILSASYLVEVVFGIPGLGRLSLDAIRRQDTALVLGTTLVPVFVAVVGNLLQDLAYGWLDPRIDYGDR